MTRNVVSDYGMDPSRAEALRTVMEEAFPDATVEGWEKIEPDMRNDPKDRHVVAAAVAAEATVVTSNIRDFSNLPDGIVAMTPDEFLSKIFAKDPTEVLDAITVSSGRIPATSADHTGVDRKTCAHLTWFRRTGARSSW